MKIAYVIDKNSSALGIAAAMRQEVVPEIDRRIIIFDSSITV